MPLKFIFLLKFLDLLKFCLQGYFTDFQNVWKLTIEGFRNLMADYWNAFQNLMGKLIDKITGLIEIGLRGYFEDFKILWKNILDAFRGLLKDYWTVK